MKLEKDHDYPLFIVFVRVFISLSFYLDMMHQCPSSGLSTVAEQASVSDHHGHQFNLDCIIGVEAVNIAPAQLLATG